MEKLPEHVDVVVLGTGLPESILASACSRSGLSVLHLDRTEFYGGDWASFNLRSINEWFSSMLEKKEEEIDLKEKFGSLVEEGEQLIRICERETITNLEYNWTEEASNSSTELKIKDDVELLSLKDYLNEKEWRRFSIDLVPKVLLARGPMVQTLCDSEVAKYAEFKCVDRFLCCNFNEKGEKTYNRVPCSKGDIFQDEKLSMIDKRRLMKFLTYCLQWNSKSDSLEEWKKFSDRKFTEFLESMGITGTLQQYVADAIGILHPNANTKEGLTAVCKFIDSVGRFGASPFLTPLYGCGELSQCFCRLCAVFGGLYCLGRPIQAFVERDGKYVGVIADDQLIRCEHIVMSPKYATEKDNLSNEKKEWLHRSINIIKQSIFTEEKEHVSLVNLSQFDIEAAVRYFENGYEVCAAPKGYYLANFSGKGSLSQLKEVVQKTLCNKEESQDPSALWSLYFSVLSSVEARTPPNVAVVPGPDHSLDYASVIAESQRLFNQFWPDRDFLPRSLKLDEEGESDVPPVGEEMQTE